MTATGTGLRRAFAALADFIRELIVSGTREAWSPPAPAAASAAAPA